MIWKPVEESARSILEDGKPGFDERAVVHDEVVIGKLPGHAKFQGVALAFAVVDDGTPTERTPRHSDWVAPGGAAIAVKHVVDEFVIMHVPYRVRAGSTGRSDYDDSIVGVTVVRGTERRVVDAGNRVPRNHLTDVHMHG